VARYFFHLRYGEDVLLDPEGVDLPDTGIIASRAMHEARSILSHEAIAGRLRLDQRIDVEEADGTIVHSLPFCDAIEIVPPR